MHSRRFSRFDAWEVLTPAVAAGGGGTGRSYALLRSVKNAIYGAVWEAFGVALHPTASGGLAPRLVAADHFAIKVIDKARVERHVAAGHLDEDPMKEVRCMAWMRDRIAERGAAAAAGTGPSIPGDPTRLAMVVDVYEDDASV